MSNHVFLVEYEINSHAIVAPPKESLIFQHPTKKVSIEIKNQVAAPGLFGSILIAYVVLESQSFETAENDSLECLEEFVDILTFSSNLHFSIGSMLRIADWSPGITERKGIIFKKFPGDERPYPIIEDKLLETIQILASSNISHRLKRALRWFSHGVSSKYPDEKFQFFWYVVEILSQEVKPTKKIADACPVCRNPLFCDNCNQYPTHRPYPKQAIAHLFSLALQKDNGDFFNISNEFRNALMHGDNIETIEKKFNVEFDNQVDLLGKVAWVSILNILRKKIPEDKKNTGLHLIETNIYCEYEFQMRIGVTFKSKNPEKPCISDIPQLDVEMTHRD